MRIVEEAYAGILPNKDFNYEYSVRYSNRLKPYNAVVRKTGNQLDFHLSRAWRGVSREIVLGLFQDLLARILNTKSETSNMKLYNNFIRNIHLAAPRKESPPELIASFERINSQFFSGLMEQPNIEWGQDSRNRLATYDYHTDTIRISTSFQKAKQELLDYLMHHEMLHKHFKFNSSKGRTIHHSREFRLREKQFPDSERLEKELKRLTFPPRFI